MLLSTKLDCFNMVVLHSKLFGASSKYARSTFLATIALDWWVWRNKDSCLSLSVLSVSQPFFDSSFRSYRKRSSWMARSFSLYYDVRVRWHTVILRSSRLTRFSTWPSGSCVSSHAPYHGPVCCVSGTYSSVKVPFKYTTNSTKSSVLLLYYDWTVDEL